MNDRYVSNESLREIIVECKQLIQQLDQQLEGLSVLLMEKPNAFTDER
ncbi:hypothetical protein [Paenibacillus lignilyticus]|uniref:Uncharacterized protein n=1 Tax=Paenibacillus lignilyticus TaxID=1172615 RepID=A0ABS5CN72_9BACL|nr:hypothetical protein [Paenibacillus lignilyticus]MBP3967313.1 hypothetical protein [Paenibacillus lignilyticus]